MTDSRIRQGLVEPQNRVEPGSSRRSANGRNRRICVGAGPPRKVGWRIPLPTFRPVMGPWLDAPCRYLNGHRNTIRPSQNDKGALMGGTLQKICKWWRDRTDPAAKYRYDALCRSLDRRRCSTPRGVLKDAYAASVQLSHRPRTHVLEGRPSRSRGQG